MPDYVYLLENRLSADQRHALRLLREVAREAGMLLFLTGDAVRDLTSGHAVRELELSLHGNALKLKKPIEKAGGKVWGEDEASRTLYLCFQGTVRVDLVSAHTVEYLKPGKTVCHPASIQEDLRRRDFTVNAMAISLNEGSFGLLMDPLNGAADIEARALRLVSNYGFLEEPALLIRAARYRARLGWDLDAKTQTRYENAKAEGVIEFLAPHARGEELEQIGHEEDGLKVLDALEAEGWMKVLFPAWTPAKADAEGIKLLHDQVVELLMQGIRPDTSAAQMQLLTAKLGSKEVAALKKLMVRPGFVEEWDSLDAMAAGFAKALLAKANQTPSATFKLFMSYDPEAILWLGFTSKDAAVRERYNQFLKVWPEARQRIPHALMQEMRITPELPAYSQIVESLFLEFIDGRLTTPEDMRAFLEPHSPPAPPPQITIKRTRAKRGAEPKFKERALDEEEEPEDPLEDDEMDEIVGDDDEIDLGIPIPKADLEGEMADDVDGEHEAGDEDEADADEAEPVPAVKRGSKAANAAKAPVPPPAKDKKAAALKPAPAPTKPQTPAPKPATIPTPAAKPQPAPPAKSAAPSPAQTKQAPTPPAKPAPAATSKSASPAISKPKAIAPAKPSAPPVKPVKTAAAKPAPKAPPAKPEVKAGAKPAAKVLPKPPAKPVQKKATPTKAKPAPIAKSAAKSLKPRPAPKPAKPAAKKPAPKPAKKR
jgi:tRNA nucleotidyltransferase (CCA-adding enzyme)